MPLPRHIQDLYDQRGRIIAAKHSEAGMTAEDERELAAIEKRLDEYEIDVHRRALDRGEQEVKRAEKLAGLYERAANAAERIRSALSPSRRRRR